MMQINKGQKLFKGLLGSSVASDGRDKMRKKNKINKRELLRKRVNEKKEKRKEETKEVKKGRQRKK